MANSIKEPPMLVDDNKYETFKRDVHIWSKLSTLPKKKQALAIHLTLRGRAKNASSQLTDAQLESDDGVALIFEKLDALFLPDKSRRQFSAFNKLYNLRKPEALLSMILLGNLNILTMNLPRKL